MPAAVPHSQSAPRFTIEERDGIALVRWPNASFSDAVFAEALSQFSALARSGRPYAILHDARQAPLLSASQRRMAAQAGERDRAYSGKWCRASALVFDNPVLRGILTAIDWVFRPPFPQRVFSDMESATAWCTKQLADDIDALRE